jgi:nitronate monooxygenase
MSLTRPMNNREEQVYPRLIQGGMGVAVSSWKLARAVAACGQLGVVSGTALDAVLIRRLELGDLDGSLRQAFDEFPFPEIANRVWKRYYVAGGKPAEDPFSPIMALSESPKREHVERVVLANFAEVFLAKRGHQGSIGINLLEKIHAPTLASLYGAMLADVDYVLMGAGIPKSIPGVLDRFADGEPARLPLFVEGAKAGEVHCTEFSPELFTGGEVPWLRRPKFLAIVSSATLATMLSRKSNGQVDGFIVEGHKAGGHNAPPTRWGSAERPRRTRLWTTRRSGSGGLPDAKLTVLAGWLVRIRGVFERGAASWGYGNSSRHRFRFL